MEKQTYNGWTNYATWRVNLEIFDGFDPTEYFTDIDNDNYWKEELADNLKEYAEQLIENVSDIGLARDYALAFLSDVNWQEIAQHMINDYAEV